MAANEKSREVHASEILRRLDELGAIKLGVLVEKSTEIQGILGASLDDDDHGICYPAYIHIGPHHDIDLVSVAAQLKQLGFQITRANSQLKT